MHFLKATVPNRSAMFICPASVRACVCVCVPTGQHITAQSAKQPQYELKLDQTIKPIHHSRQSHIKHQFGMHRKTQVLNGMLTLSQSSIVCAWKPSSSN